MRREIATPIFIGPQRAVHCVRSWLTARICIIPIGLAGVGATLFSMNSPAATPRFINDPAEFHRLEQAVPSQATATPKKPRRLLIFDLNVGYGGHSSIAYANEAFSLAGQKTGAFETVVSRDPRVFAPESLRQFDAVFFNNNVGNLFEDAALRQSLVEFVYRGGGLMGVHGATVAFTKWPGAIEDWPEFGIMLGARGANHKDSDEQVFIHVEDPENPVNRAFHSRDFSYRDEFFRVHGPYSRQRVRVLLSIDTRKTEMDKGQPRGDTLRSDNDYALAWIRNYGRGRVFYCTIAHNPYVFWDPTLLPFYLDAIQFVLGDLNAPTLPSAKLTPAVRAQEKLGWRLGLSSQVAENRTFFESLDLAGQLNLAYVSGRGDQVVSRDIPKPLDEKLTPEERAQIRLKLDSVGVRMTAYVMTEPAPNRQAWRERFAWARAMGVDTIVAVPAPAELAFLTDLAREYDLILALRNLARSQTGHHWTVEALRQIAEHPSTHVGVAANLANWIQDGAEPVNAIKQLGPLIYQIELGELLPTEENTLKAQPRANPAQISRILAEIHRLDRTMVQFDLPCSSSDKEMQTALGHSLDWLNQQFLNLTD